MHSYATDRSLSAYTNAVINPNINLIDEITQCEINMISQRS